ncbi:MAG: hypothetical protein RIC06_13475 [Cyclobacteriaceae bacterium]
MKSKFTHTIHMVFKMSGTLLVMLFLTTNLALGNDGIRNGNVPDVRRFTCGSAGHTYANILLFL